MTEEAAEIAIEEIDAERSNHVVCAQCKRPFVLRWEESFLSKKPCTLVIRGCPSGGVYDVSLSCPYCDYEEAL